jgi:hypothetical protein
MFYRSTKSRGDNYKYFFNQLVGMVVQHDILRILYLDQTKSLMMEFILYYNFNNDIYKQYNLYEIKDVYSGTIIWGKRRKASIDFNKTFTNITTI